MTKCRLSQKLKNKDIIASGEAFDTLSPEWKIDIKGGERVVKKLSDNGNFQTLNNSASKRHNKYVSALEELINNSVYKNYALKNKPKPNVKQYYNFDVPVAIGETIYTVRLQAEEWKGDKKQKGVKTI